MFQVAQIAAHELGIPLNFVQIKPSTNLTSPNTVLSAGSTSTDAVGFVSF